jgi:zinc transport system ATP-binding protein
MPEGRQLNVIEARGVAFAYGRGPAVLAGVDLTVAPGEFVGIAGPNGGGKTTLIRLLVGLEEPTAGEIRIFGKPPREAQRAARIGYLPQRAESGLDAPITVEELVTSGRTPVAGLWRSLRVADREAVAAAIERVGLTDRAGIPIDDLSGGQRQRAFIARALAGDPQLIVLDEPTTGVDAEAQESLARLLDELRRELNVAVLYVSHEFGSIEPYVGRLVVVRAGIEFDGPPSELHGGLHDPSHLHLH